MKIATFHALVLALASLSLMACEPLGGLERELRSRLPGSSADPMELPSQSAPDGSAEAAIQLAIYRTNFQQEQAIASRDPTGMKDTATDGYYREMVRINDALLGGGVVSVKLIQLDWGLIAVRGNSARATTYETWMTSLADGTTQQSRDRNVYTLIQQAGAWKIQSDDHPDERPRLPPGGPEV